MSSELYKFPSTPHLVWLSEGGVRDDKVMTREEASDFLTGAVVVEEKVDGANLGISFDDERGIRLQNRGNWLEGKLTGQWEQLRGWVAEHEAALSRALPKWNILFGEWCYAVHSIRYDRLPDWFLAFDVYDRAASRFWSSERRNALLAEVRMATVPEITRGAFTVDELSSLLDAPSTLHSGLREGLYLRREDRDWLVARAKLVRPGFSQAIAEHWSRKRMVRNRVCSVAVPAE